jgi:hypothetical protein
MPPAPKRPSKRYGPTDAGSSGRKSLIIAGAQILGTPEK